MHVPGDARVLTARREGVRLRWRRVSYLAELLLLGLEPSSRACLSLSLSLSLSLTRDASEYSLGA